MTEKEGTASLANIYGYDVGGKTGTSQKYGNKNENLNTFISEFPSKEPKYTLLVMLENPQVAKNLVYDYKGLKIKAFRNEAGWNSVYVAGKIIKKIGPILAINNKDFDYRDLDGLNYSTWEDQNQTLAQALSTEKNVMFVILFFIIVISSFTIISNQIFFIKEKYKDIILLKALGIKQSKICFIFFSFTLDKFPSTNYRFFICN